MGRCDGPAIPVDKLQKDACFSYPQLRPGKIGALNHAYPRGFIVFLVSPSIQDSLFIRILAGNR